MLSRFDRLLACDRQTDGQTSWHGIVRAIHTRCAVKILQKPCEAGALPCTLLGELTALPRIPRPVERGLAAQLKLRVLKNFGNKFEISNSYRLT